MLTRAATRAFSTEALKVINDVAKQQFTVALRGEDATLKYQLTGKNITFVSTDVPKIFEGKGIGKNLAQHAFKYAQENELNVTVQCSFLAKYYKNHMNQYNSLKVKIDEHQE